MGYGARASQGKRFTCPPKGAPVGEFAAFFKTYFDHESPTRIERLTEFYETKCYLENIHWLQRGGGKYTVKPGRSFRLETQDDEPEIPKPVTNEILPIHDHMVGKIRNRKSEPQVRARSIENEGKVAAGRVGDQVIKGHLDYQKWPHTRREIIWSDVSYGTGIAKSEHVLDFCNTERLGAEGVTRCVSCGFMLASPDVPAASVVKLAAKGGIAAVSRLERKEGEWEPGQGRQATYTAKGCLECGDPMMPHLPVGDEVNQKDIVGRDLGQDVPRGEPRIEHVPVWHWFPENEGLMKDPMKMRCRGEASVESLDDVAQRYGLRIDEEGRYWTRGKDPQELKAQDATELAENVPILGEAAPGNLGTASISGRYAYHSHCEVRRYSEDPSPRYPKGRWVVMAHNLLVQDDDLMIEEHDNPGSFYPRIVYAQCRYMKRDGESWGMGLVEPLKSPQRRVNMRWSQIISQAERCTTHGIIAPRGTKLHFPGMLKGHNGIVAFYEPDDMNPGLPNGGIQTFPTQPPEPMFFQEIDKTVVRMGEIAGIVEADIGKQQFSGMPALSFKLQGEKSGERREQRIEELITLFETLFSHQLLLLRDKTHEPKKYWIRGQSNAWEELEFKGADLQGQADVVVGEEPAYDRGTYEAQAIDDGLKSGVLVADTPYAKFELAKALGLPTAAWREANVQYEDAERKWGAFRDDQEVAVINPSIDNHALKFQIYGMKLMSDEGQAILKQENWDRILLKIGGWEERLMKSIVMEAQRKQAKGRIESPFPPDPMNPAESVVTPQMQMLAQQDPLPVELSMQIVFVWQRMIAETLAPGIAMMPRMIPKPDKASPTMRFMAVVEGHRLLAEGKAGQAASGAPVAAAPGATGPQPVAETPPPAEPQAAMVGA